MKRPSYTSKVRWFPVLLGALIVAWCLGIGAAFADDKVAQPTEVVDPSEPASDKAKGSPPPVAEVLPAPDDGAGIAAAEKDAQSQRQRADDADLAVATAQTAFTTLAGQLSTLDMSTKKALIGPVAAKAIRLGVARGGRALLTGQVGEAAQRVVILKVQAARTKALNESNASVKSDDGENAEAEAIKALELAKKREEQERDTTLKELLARERRLAEDLLAVTREHIDAMDQIEHEAEQAATSFSKAKAELLSEIDTLPSEPSAQSQHETADPALTELIELRRTARTHLRDAHRQLRRISSEVSERRAASKEAEAAVAAERKRSEQLEGAVGERRVAVAKAQFNVAGQTLDGVIQQRDAYEALTKAYRERIDFLNSSIESLLPLCSASRRSEFFALGRDDNWSDAVASASEGAMRILEGAIRRGDQLIGLEWMSITAGAWLWGLIWRILLAFVLIRIVPARIPDQVKRLSGAAFRRRTFRTRPRRTVKTAEVINALGKPVFGYIAFRYVLAEHIVNTFPELDVIIWLVNGWFAYWLTVEVASALVLPRARRNELGKNSAAPLDLGEAEATALADFTGFELKRAVKLLRSVRVVVAFSLLAHYIPQIVEKVVGISVISWLVNFIAGVGLFGIIYWVISTWRDDIAGLFARLAKDRLPKAVAIVNERKDHFYGVLIIAIACIYVVTVELSVIVRHYVIDTDAFRRASNFAFRKKIEMQAQKQDAEVEEVDDSSIPAEYKELFRGEPLEVDSSVHIARAETTSAIFEEFTRWQEKKRQGSVALIGEAGIGKTTALRHLVSELETEEMVVFRTATGKRHRRGDVLEFVAQLFDIELPRRANKAELIELIRDAEPRVLVVDDCHHFFMRRIGGFEGLEALLDIVNLTDQTHFWVLAFNVFSWSYANRVSAREHYFGRVVSVPAWTEDEIQELIGARNQQSSFAMSFTEMAVSLDEDDSPANYFHEVVKTERGYFRYLHEFCEGNPRIAMVYWLRSIRPVRGTMQVSLFRLPAGDEFDTTSDNHWFVLSALAQHGQLDAGEIARVINTDEGFCHLALNFFEEVGVVTLDPDDQRANLTPTYFRYVIRKLKNSNYLYR